MTDITADLQALFSPERVKEQEPMTMHTHFRVGGPARWFVEAKKNEEIEAVLDLARQKKVPVFVLGGGSNVLVSDDGYHGLVVKLANRQYKIEGTTVTAEAGVLSAFLARKTAEAGLAGLEWAISLPGTIGGAVRGNAGCFGGEMKDTVTKVYVYRNGGVIELSHDQMQFDYRHSVIKHSDDIILSVVCELKEGDSEQLTATLVDIVDQRKSSQPLYAGSAGCMFKNYEISSNDDLQRLEQEVEIPASMLFRKKISTGWLIHQMGLRGTQIGDAKISEEHGNFIVNMGKATASDIIQLVSLVKTRARDQYGIHLHEEIQYVGFGGW